MLYIAMKYTFDQNLKTFDIQDAVLAVKEISEQY